MAVIGGRLQIRDWTDKEGNKRRNAEVIVDNIYFGDSKRRDSDSQASAIPSYDNSGMNTQAAPLDTLPAFGEFSDDDGDLPF